MPALADAVLKACAIGLWGNKGSCLDYPVVKEVAAQKGLKLDEEKYIETSAHKSVPLIGEGNSKSYSVSEAGYHNVNLIVSYPSVHVSINGRDALMTVDSGAQTTAIYASKAKRLGVAGLRGVHHAWKDLAGVSRSDLMGVVDNFDFANMNVKHKYVIITKNYGDTAVDGVIGLDILAKMHALMFTKRELRVRPKPPRNCGGTFTVSSDLYSNVYGVRAWGVSFNGRSAIAVLDTGNAASGISATWDLVRRENLEVFNQRRVISSGLGGASSSFKSGDIAGKLDYLGRSYEGTIEVFPGYRGMGIDFNIGAPFFYGKNLYLDFDTRKICLSSE
jgi:hypothetical protein